VLIAGFGMLAWPRVVKDSPREAARDVLLVDAIGRAFCGKWERVDWNTPGLGQAESDRLGELVMHQVRQLAYEGKLPLWGKKFATDIWRPIPPEFWKDHTLDWFGFLKGRPEGFGTAIVLARPGDGSNMQEQWSELMTSRARVEDIWPAHKGALP
jgi:hypothetical protein